MRCFVVPEGTPAAQPGYAQVLAVHAALLHTGKIVYFSGDEHDPGRHHLGMFDHARLFDCGTLAISSPAASASIRDLFCCGHAFLADGRLLVAGGTEAWTTDAIAGDPHGHAGAGHFRGTAEAYVFDPATEHWVPVQRMRFEPGHSAGGGRWYPTLFTLGNGDVAALSGHPSDSDTRHYNNSIESFDPRAGASGAWADMGILPAAAAGYPDLTYYPRLHLLPDGKVFFSSPINGQSMKWNPNTLAFAPVGAGPGNDYDGIGVTSVLLPLLHEEGFRPRVLMCGRPLARRIDLGDPAPAWQTAGSRTLLVSGTPPERQHNNAVLLPTGEVAIVGGMRDPANDPGAAVLDVEIYRPATNSWVTLPPPARCSVSRNYHSVALLMPDGRVWMGGSNIRANWSFHNAGDYPPGTLPTNAQDGSTDNRQLRIELFEPWYFGRPDRPALSLPSTEVSVGEDFTVQTPQAATVSRVAVIRAGSVTHSFNTDQRYVGLPFTHASASTLTVSVPDNENLLPPGYYLLFILNQVIDPGTGAVLDVPSVGHFIRIDNAKSFKELKWEIKELKVEIKENLKSEIDVIVKDFEWPPKLKDAEDDPFERFKHLGDPVELIKTLAQHVDNLARTVTAATGRAFIKTKERPLVARRAPTVPLAEQRTPPPTEAELMLRDPHRHEDARGHEKPDHKPGGKGGGHTHGGHGG
ncbi:MAG TPA: galactose oxidase-like domain-containing protein [Thermoanaerobaculia bacterium]|nr:galactose oxidase-like domain-containing protein [Thermoanaerobaculia bacterium]